MTFSAVVIRLWETTNNHTNILFVWAIELNGLLYIPPKQTLASNMFLTNSLIFCMTGGNFAPTHCMTGDQPTLTRITDLTLPGKDIKKSGSLVQLTRYLQKKNKLIRYFYNIKFQCE